jgi:hypothetical protein
MTTDEKADLCVKYLQRILRHTAGRTAYVRNVYVQSPDSRFDIACDSLGALKDQGYDPDLMVAIQARLDRWAGVSDD